MRILIGALMNPDLIPALQWVEISSTLQIPSFHIVGLPGPEVAEARERVRAAILAAGFEFPRRRVLLNLSPASVRKQGTGVDLAMALAVLAQAHEAGLPKGRALRELRPLVALGELGLDGTIKASGQILRSLYAAWKAGAGWVFLAHDEAAAARDALSLLAQDREFSRLAAPRIVAASHLQEAWGILLRLLEGEDAGEVVAPQESAVLREESPVRSLLPLSPSLERILGAAAAGGHHLLLLGPKGMGKSHALEWLAALQPAADPAIRITQGLLAELHGRTFDRAHSTVRRIGTQVRPAALLGSMSATALRPGEFSLAHGGLLIADEFPEWPRDSREALREPMERGKVTLTRARATLEMPARFTLAANGNFCPCGGWPARIPLPPVSDAEAPDRKVSRCHCPIRVQRKYLSRLSGPILDRTDLVVRILQHPSRSGTRPNPGQRADELRDRVRKARELSCATWGAPAGLLDSSELEALLDRNPEWSAHSLLRDAPSLRSRHKTLRVALSLAGWDGLTAPRPAHFHEASCYRSELLATEEGDAT